MNEEEKQAIEYWKTHLEILHCNTQIASEHYIKVLLDLVEKQQKEIEKQQKEIKARLEEIDSLYKMMSAKDDEIETLKESQMVIYGQKGEIVGVLKYPDDAISKDKIKEKIEELKEYIYETEEKTCGRCITIGESKAIQILRELLGE